MKRKLLKEWFDGDSAGTDHPIYHDEKSGDVYEATWDGNPGYAFGYWKDGDGRYVMGISDTYEMHDAACGKIAKSYVESVFEEMTSNDADTVADLLDDLHNEVFKYGSITYNEDDDTFVNEDGEEFDLSQWVWDAEDSEDYRTIGEEMLAEEARNAMSDENYSTNISDLANEALSEQMEGCYFTDKESINDALEKVGSSFDHYFEEGSLQGRIWPQEELFGFYSTPSSSELAQVIKDLSIELPRQQNDGITYDEMLKYNIIYEDYNDNEVHMCSVENFIYGIFDNEDEDDEAEQDDNKVQQSNEPIEFKASGKQFIPHLATQKEKWDYFQNYRNDRDKTLYVPRERAAGSLAAYHAMRYPYGESFKRIGRIIREEIMRQLD